MRKIMSMKGIFAMLFALVLIASACSSDDDSVTDGSDGETTSDNSDDGATGTDDSDSADGEGSMSDGSALTVAVDWDVAPRGFDGVDFASELFPFYSLVYDSLFTTSVAGEVEPSLVAMFSQNEETTDLVMTLKEGAVFADGTILDAAAVKANLDRRLDPASSPTGDGVINYNVFLEGEEGHIDEVLVTGDYEVTIKFTKPVRAAHELLADSAGIIINPNSLGKDGVAAAPDGSGPYALVAEGTTRGNTYSVTKKADHWNADAYAFDNVVFDVIVDDQARANAVISGQADIAIDIAPSLLDLVEAESTLTSIGGVMGAVPMFDKTGSIQPEFANLEVRHAISYAIDRDKIVEALVPGGRATSQMFPEDAVGYDPVLDDKYAYNPDKARELMASVGLQDGFSFDFVVLGAPSDLQLAVQQMLEEEINITINWDVASSTDALFASTNTQPMALAPWALGSMPAGFIRGPITTGFMNNQGATNEAIEALLGPALGGDPAALRALNETVIDEGWWISIYEAKFYTGYDADTVQAPAFAGTNNYMVMSQIKPA